MPSVCNPSENCGFAHAMLVNLDDDYDFQASLQTAFDQLKGLLLRLHISELDALRHENECLRADLGKSRHDVGTDIAVRSSSTTRRSEFSVGKLSSCSHTQAILETEHLAVLKFHVEESQSVCDGTFESLADEGVQRLFLFHYHLKKIWVNLAESLSQAQGVASLASLSQRLGDEIVDSSFYYRSTEDRYVKYASLFDCSMCAWLARFVMYPHSRKRFTWALLSLLLLAYDFIMIPFAVSFDLEDNSFDEVMQMVSCIFWTCDIVLTLFTGFYSNFRLIMDPVHIFLNYVESWLAFDICLVTLDWSVMLLKNIGEASLLSMFRGIRVVRIMRMLRLVRVARVAKFRALINELFVVTPDILHSFLRVMKMLLFIIAFLHIGACAWAVIGKMDGGWIQASKLDEDPIRYQYAVALHWMLSALQGSRPTLVVAHRASELFIDNVIVLVSFVLTSFFVATITLAVITHAESETSKIHRMAKRYLKAHDCSAETRMKTHRFLQSHNLDGPAELIAYEAQLFRAFPRRLQEDLRYESRATKLCRTSNFAILHQLSTRCVQQLCNEMYDKLAVEGESVFMKGDACNHLYMIREGLFKYRCVEEVLAVTPRQLAFPRLPDSMTGCDILCKGQFLCEASFWTDWENVGELGAIDNYGLLLMFDADKFAHILLRYRVGRAHAAKYSHHFVRRLNRCYSCDITGFDIEMSELDTPAYDCAPEDHFAFISHYKVESGTEATLMRNLMSTIIRSDPKHEANDYMSAFFVDSEDLEDLARLQDHVGGSTNIVILLTPGLLLRPWCLLEFVTAVRKNITLVPVEIQRPGLKYIYPDEEWYASLRRGETISKESMALLVGMGTNLKEVEHAIRQVFLKIALPFSPHKSGTIQSAEILDILKRCKQKQNPFRSVLSGTRAFD